MKTADLITSFLSNEMTPDQERQFLVSVAASDSMRLSLKSHVMLDRIAANQLQRAEVPVQVREAIFAQMSASMAEPAPSTPAVERSVPRSGAGAKAAGGFIRKFGTQALVMMMTAGGFVAGYLAGNDQPESAPAPAQQVQSTPAVTAEVPAGPSVATGGTSAAPQAGLAAESPAPVEARELATAEPSVRERSRSVRSISRDAGTAVQLRDRQAASPNASSNPLEPANGIPKASVPASTAAVGADVNSTDTLSNSVPTSAKVEATIRRSDDTSGPQDPKGD